MTQFLAQSIKITGYEIKGPLEGPGGAKIETVADVVGIFVNFLFPLAGVLLFVFLVWGGFDFLTSSGNPEKVKSGKAKITSAIIGFILLVLSFFVVRIVTYVLGLKDGVI
jgi:hypothetical protein